MARGLFSLAFSFLSVTPSKQSSPHQSLPFLSYSRDALRSACWGPVCGAVRVAGFKSGPCVTLAKLPDFSVRLSCVSQ